MPIFRGFRFSIGVVLLAMYGFAAQTASAQDALNPGGAYFPVPPQQSAPWTAPKTKLMPLVLGAIATFFDQGLPDPRGCEYREIEISFSEREGFEFTYPSGSTKTHGWVIPARGGRTCAIGWNGVIYPVSAVGPPADLRADVEGELKKDKDEIAACYKGATPRTGVPIDYRSHYDDSSARDASFGRLGQLHAAFLLRLGYPRLVDSVWAQWFYGHPEHSGEDTYVDLANAWMGSLYLTALSAHQRGDDTRALAAAQALTDLRPKLEVEATRRGLSKPPDFFRPGEPRITYFPFLIDLPDLLADQQRRHAEAPYVPVAQMVPPPQGKERIALMIRDLELVYAPPPQWGLMTPGIGHAPLIRDLVKQGGAAVGPLLDCLQNDRRLTRAVAGGELIEVDVAAYAALCQILHIPRSGGYPPHLSPIARQSFVDQVRAHQGK
jgi:hypothetical protein